MRVFVTGASGFIGSAVIKELLSAGYSVLGLARSDESAKAVAALGAAVHRGSIEDLESLKSGAATSDAVIHLAFNHDFTRFAQNCEDDRRAIETIGAVLKGSERPFLVTGGLGRMNSQDVITESDKAEFSDRWPRASEQAAMELAETGVRAGVVRLPQVHDNEHFGLITFMVEQAKQSGAIGYIGDGANKLAAVHVDDCARLYRLALEDLRPGARYHAVAESGVRMKDVAETISKRLGIPAKSIQIEEAPKFFGMVAMFANLNLTATSEITQKRLNWIPKGVGLLEDLANMPVAVAK